MGKGARRARRAFTGEWLLDPGAEDRRRAFQNQQTATEMWEALRDGAPGVDLLDASIRSSAIPDESRDATYAQALGAQRGSLEAQRRALEQMQGIASAGGYTGVERGQIRQAQQQAAQHERSQRLAALNAMQARGMAGGGAELASRMAAQQSGANRAANDAVNIATAAQQRALQAMQASGGMAAQMGQTGGDMARQRLARGNAINAFNLENANRRSRAAQQAFDNQATITAGGTGQYNANAQSAFDQAQQKAAATGSLVNGVIGAIV